MIFNTGGYANSYPRPSDDVDVRVKNDSPDWSLQFAKFVYSQYSSGRCTTTIAEQELIGRNRAYAAGRQDPELYKKILLGDKTGPNLSGDSEDYMSLLNSRDGLMNVNFDSIFSPCPKYLLSLQGIMDSSEFDVTVSAIDENSTSLKQELKWSSMVEGEYEDMFQYINTVMELPSETPKPRPKNSEEVEMFANMGSFRLAYEISMQDALNYTEEISGKEKLRRSIGHDLFSIGKSSALAFTDSAGVVKYRYADPADTFVEFSREEDGSDASFGAVQIFETISDFRASSGLPEDDIKNIATRYIGKFDNYTPNALEEQGNGFTYDHFRVPVLHVFWKSTDSEYKTTHKDGRIFNEPYKRGGWKAPNMLNTESRKTSKDSIRSLYSCKWVIDTDYVYDYGRCKDIPFDYYTKDVRIPIVTFKIPGKPIVEQMMPILDQIQLTFLKLQNAIAKSPPPGLAIEMSSLDNITMGDKKIRPLDLISVYTQEGILLYRQAPPVPGNPIGIQRPIEQLASQLGPAITAHVQAIEMFGRELEMITGISNVALGQSNPNQGLGVSQMAAGATTNTLRPILDGWVSIRKGLLGYSAIKVQSTIVNNEKKDCPYYEILGGVKWSAIKSAGEFPPSAWGIFVRPKLDTTVKMEVIAAAKAGLSVGKDGIPILSFSEYLHVIDSLNAFGNVSAVRAYIAYKEQVAAKDAERRAIETQKMQGEITIQTNQAKAKSEQEALAAKTQMELQRIDAQFRADAALAILNHKLKMAELGAGSPEVAQGIEQPAIVQPEAPKGAIQGEFAPQVDGGMQGGMAGGMQGGVQSGEMM